MYANFNELIREICKENNIKCNIISEGLLIVLEKDNIRKFIIGYKFDNNNHALGSAWDDKFATYELLKLYNIPVVEHNLVYALNNEHDYAKKRQGLLYVQKIFAKYKDVVIKGNRGTCGSNVFRFNDLDKFKEFYMTLKRKNKSFSICPYYKIENEFRVIVLNNKVEVLYKKELPMVKGNGKATIKELLEEFNYEYFKNINDEKLNGVLRNQEEYVYNWKFNLSRGARASFDVGEYDKSNIIEIIGKMFANLHFGFCSIDIIKTFDGKYLVMEVNSGVMMKNLIKEKIDGRDIAKEVYKKAILDLLK